MPQAPPPAQEQPRTGTAAHRNLVDHGDVRERTGPFGPAWVAVAVVAALANVNFLLAGPLGAHVDLGVGVISELSVSGQPGAGWFRIGDGLAGLLCVLLALPVRRERWRACALAGFGAGTFVSALVPLTCAASLTSCPPSSLGAEIVHDGVSVLGTVGAVVGVFGLVRRTRGAGRLAAGAVALGVVGTGAWEVVTFLAGGNGAGGAAQRVQVVAVSAWVLLEAVSGGRDRRRTGQDDRRRHDGHEPHDGGRPPARADGVPQQQHADHGRQDDLDRPQQGRGRADGPAFQRRRVRQRAQHTAGHDRPGQRFEGDAPPVRRDVDGARGQRGD